VRAVLARLALAHGLDVLALDVLALDVLALDVLDARRDLSPEDEIKFTSDFDS
jgi:hypothetical protein